MEGPIEWLLEIITSYPALRDLVVFLGAAFGGEIAVVSLSFLAAQKVFPLYSFIIISFLGTFTSDILWFLLGRTKTIENIITHRYAHSTVSLITETVEKVSRGNHFLALIIAKIMVGTRVILLMYVSRKNLSLGKFILFDSVAVLFWLLVVIPIGYVSGLGYSYLSNIFENIYAGIGFFLLMIFGIILFHTWLKRKFTKEN